MRLVTVRRLATALLLCRTVAAACCCMLSKGVTIARCRLSCAAVAVCLLPCCRFREANAFGGVAQLPTVLFQYCVLTPATQMSLVQNTCFDSCNSAVVCSNVNVSPVDAVAGTRGPANAACQNLLDSSPNTVGGIISCKCLLNQLPCSHQHVYGTNCIQFCMQDCATTAPAC